MGQLTVLVEGPSDREFVSCWLRRAYPSWSARVLQHAGRGRIADLGKPESIPKPQHRSLLHQLRAKARAWAKAAKAGDGLVVLVDRDADDCLVLKDSIVKALEQEGVRREQFLVRVAVRSLEAFYLGEPASLIGAFGPVPTRELPAVPDEATNPVEILERLLEGRARPNNKVTWARVLGEHVSTDTAASRSASFRAWGLGLRRFGAQLQEQGAKKRMRRVPPRQVVRRGKKQKQARRSKR